MKRLLGLPEPRSAQGDAPRNRPDLPVLAACVAVVIWGASPAAIMLAVESIPADLVGGLRSVLAFALMTPALVWHLKAFPQQPAGQVELLLGGLAGFAAYPMLLSIGTAATSVGHAAIILAAAPITTGILGFVLTAHWPRSFWWGGAALALAGVVFLVSGGPAPTTSPSSLRGDAIVLASVLFASVGYVMGGRLSARIGKWPATFWMLAVGAAALLPATVPGALAHDWMRVSLSAWIGLATLVVLVTIVGYALWFWALGVAQAGRIAPLQFGQPVVGLALAVALFGEPFSPGMLAATAMIVGGVGLCMRMA
jgi:drug/metabolite transporter (DMT)-like permease